MLFSIWIGIKRTLGTPGGVFGWIIASVSLFNLVSALFTIPLSTVVTEVLRYYRAVMHTLVDWVLAPFAFALPPYGKDLFVLYLVIGGVLLRFMELDEDRKGVAYSFKSAFSNGLKAPFFSTTQLPTPWRQILVFTLWPVFIYTIVYNLPYIIYTKYTEGEKVVLKATGSYIGEGRPTNEIFQDKRIVFYTSLVLTLAGMFFLFALNAFTAPALA